MLDEVDLVGGEVDLGYSGEPSLVPCDNSATKNQLILIRRKASLGTRHLAESER